MNEMLIMTNIFSLIVLLFLSSSVVYAGPFVVPHSKLNHSVNIRNISSGAMLKISDTSIVAQIQDMFKRAKRIGDSRSHLKTVSHNIDFSDRWMVDLSTGEFGILKKRIGDVYRLESQDLENLKQIIETSQSYADKREHQIE
jgi:hypothetical protein